MREYETQQRKRLFSFFTEHPDRQFTIEEISKSIEGISVSALYRNVNQMVTEGTVRRFQEKGQRKFIYQYIGEGECCEHLHLKCSRCGRILHIDKERANSVAASVKKNFDFEIDKAATIIIGECSSCK